MLVVRVLYPVLRAGEWPGGFQTGRARQESVFYSQKVNAHYQAGAGGGGNGNAQKPHILRARCRYLRAR